MSVDSPLEGRCTCKNRPKECKIIKKLRFLEVSLWSPPIMITGSLCALKLRPTIQKQGRIGKPVAANCSWWINVTQGVCEWLSVKVFTPQLPSDCPEWTISHAQSSWAVLLKHCVHTGPDESHDLIKPRMDLDVPMSDKVVSVMLFIWKDTLCSELKPAAHSTLRCTFEMSQTPPAQPISSNLCPSSPHKTASILRLQSQVPRK